MPTIQPGEAKQLLDTGAVALDVREDWEYQAGHLPGALHLPLGRLARSAEELLPDKTRNIVVYCASGVRSFQASQWLRRNGWRNVWDMGSLKAWPYGIEHF